jgi:hypothetical protein
MNDESKAFIAAVLVFSLGFFVAGLIGYYQIEQERQAASEALESCFDSSLIEYNQLSEIADQCHERLKACRDARVE